MQFDSKQGYCCSLMRAVVQKPEKNKDWSHAIPIQYTPRTREFTLMECSPLAHKGLPLAKNEVRPGWELRYCPGCGTKMPTGLRSLWWEFIEEARGMEWEFGDDENLLPEEFRTDQWWKRRGL